MMELKEYQHGTLDALVRWLETLEETQRELETMIEMFRQAPTNIPIPDELRNYPKAAWRKLRKTAALRQVQANMLTAPTTQTDPFHTSVSKCQPVVVKLCSLPPHWNASVGSGV